MYSSAPWNVYVLPDQLSLQIVYNMQTRQLSSDARSDTDSVLMLNGSLPELHKPLETGSSQTVKLSLRLLSYGLIRVLAWSDSCGACGASLTTLLSVNADRFRLRRAIVVTEESLYSTNSALLGLCTDTSYCHCVQVWHADQQTSIVRVIERSTRSGTGLYVV